jgi:two-component system, cell cycle sensor histidine kinase and response regulator CckA
MDKESLDHLFEPFFTTKARGKGTGLGMATVFGIVKQHGGHIAVYSEVGHGTTIRIYFPSSQETAGPAPVPAPTAAQSSVSSRGTILLVEDEEHVLDLSFKILRRAGYTVLSATDGRQALELFRGSPESIHLLLTDLVLPDTNGKMLHEQMRLLSPPLKVLYMSGYTANVISHHGILDEGINFIQKPFSAAALRAKVEDVLKEAGK